MGFFFQPEPPAAKAAGGRPAKATRSLDASVRGCDACPLQERWGSIATPRMQLSGNSRNPDILVLSSAPNKQDDRDGISWTGEAGRILRRALPGREMDRLAFLHAVQCWPGQDEKGAEKDPDRYAVHACSTYVEEAVEKYPIKAIIGVGQVPLSHFFPGAMLTRINGVPFPIRIAGKVLWYVPIIDPASVLDRGERDAAYPHIRADLKRFFNDFAFMGKPHIHDPDPESVLLPRSDAEAREILGAMQGGLGVDLETTGLRFARKGAQILTAAVSDGEITMAYPCAHPEAPNDWGLPFTLEIIRHRRWIAHNAAFELAWLLHARNMRGEDWEPKQFEDSMGVGRILHQRATLLSLANLSRILLGVDFKEAVKVNRANIINEPLFAVLPYNGLDAQSSALIVKHHRAKLRGKDEENYKRILGGIRSTVQMELLGLEPDIAETNKLLEHWTKQKEQAESRARTLYEVKEYERQKQSEFNLGSGDHIGEALVEFGRVDLPKTNKGKGKKYSTDDQDLKNSAPDHPLIKEVLLYREAAKIISTYIEPVLDAIENNFDGLLHPAYSVMLVATGRLSSESPNIQNFPKRRHREVRKQIKAPEGHVFCSFDFGQLEARGFCFATKDKRLIADTINKVDIHSRWRDRALELHPPYLERLAEKSNETDPKKILKSGRDTIKTDFVFASFFGSTANSCAKRTGMPLHITEKLLREFWSPDKGYAGAQAWVKAQRRLYQETGSAELLTGMVRHEILGGNEPLNTPIQGTTTGHMVLEVQNALSEKSRQLNDPYFHPRINIHDDLTFVLPDDDRLPWYIEEIAKEMTAVRFDFQNVPLMVEAKIGPNWCDLEEVGEFVGDYLK